MSNFAVRQLKVQDVTHDVVSAVDRMVQAMKLRKGETPSVIQQTLVEYLHSGSEVLVAKQDGTYVGLIMLTVKPTPYDPVAEIDNFYVDPTYRQRGLGTLLWKAVMDAARSKGFSHVEWTSSPERIVATLMYLRLPHVECNPTNRYRLSLE